MASSQQKSHTSSRNKLRWASFFMAYPNWAFIQNLSFYFIVAFFFTVPRKTTQGIFRLNSSMSVAAACFMMASVISFISAGINFGSELFFNSLNVLPNYLYWGVLVIALGNRAFSFIETMDLYKMIFWGIVASLASFHILGQFFAPIPIYRQVAQNSYAFILIIFGPIATAYLHEYKKNFLYTFIFIVLITLSGFLSGSRSGSLLTLVGGLAVLYFKNRSNLLVMTYLGLLLLLAVPNILEIPSIKSNIRGLNERTYSLIYETSETLETDRSYLTRLALIEKGMSIFEEHPLTGVGIGNFTKVDFEIRYDFEGAMFLENRENNLSTSTSAHNSYISLLSEGGLLLLLPAVFMMFYPIFYYILHFNEIKGIEGAMFISITMMCIHAWFISGMLNVFGWFLLALANSYIIHNQSKHLKWF